MSAADERREAFELPVVRSGEAAPGGMRLGLRLVAGMCSAAVLVLIGFGVRLPLGRTVVAAGELVADTVERVRAPVSGVIAEVRTRAGERVPRGAVLLSLDTTEDARRLLVARRRRALLVEQRAASHRRRAADSVVADAAQRQAQGILVRANAVLRQRIAEQAGATIDVEAWRASYKVGTSVSLDIALADVLAAEANLAAAEGRSRGGRDQGAGELIGGELVGLDGEIEALATGIEAASMRTYLGGIVATDSVAKLNGASVVQGQELLSVIGEGECHAVLRVAEAEIQRVAVGDGVRLQLGLVDEPALDDVQGVVERVGTLPDGGQVPRTGGSPKWYAVRVRVRANGMPRRLRAMLSAGRTVRAAIVVRPLRSWQETVRRLMGRR